MDITKYALDRLDFNETQINSILNEIQALKRRLKDNIKFKFDEKEIDLFLILSDESYRMKIAILKSESLTKACHLLKMNERYNWLK